MILIWTAALLGWLSLLIQPTTAFSFNFSSRVSQCADLTVTWDGGTPPWNLLMIPVGALSSGPEIRTIIDETITSGNDYHLTLKFPTGSSFIAMMSDATGVGTGGTSVILTVLDGPSNCLATSGVKPLFYFYLDGMTPSQCGTLPISWDPSAQSVRILALIPGGQSFAVPLPSSGTSLDYQVPIRSGTQVLFVGGDRRGQGTGGSSELFTVQNGSSDCIDNASPSSTAGPPAGGIYATGSGGGTVTGAPGGTSVPQSPGSGGSKSNLGAIIGGVLGGVVGLVALALILLFCWKRRKAKKDPTAEKRRSKRGSVDLLNDGHTGAPYNTDDISPTVHVPRATTPALESGTAAEMSLNGHGGPISARHSVSSFAQTDTDAGGRGTSSSYVYGRGTPTPRLPPLSVTGDGAISEADLSTIASFNHETTPTGMGRRDRTHPPSSFGLASGAARPVTPSSEGTSLQTPVTSARDRKRGSGPPTLRPVNFIIHDDAGEVPQPSGSGPGSATEEVVELPPSYADVQDSRAARAAAP